MKIHICSDSLVALEGSFAELADDEAVKLAVENALALGDVRHWPSIEITQFENRGSRLVIACPVRVYLPEFMAKLL